MTNKKLFLTLTGFALALIAYAPTSLAVNEVCQDGSNNCCVAPQIVEDGGGCGTIRGWVGDEATGSCEFPVFDPTGTGSPTVCPAGKAYNCANNSCVCPTGTIVNRCNTTQCITPPSCGGTESYCCSSEHPDAAASGSCVDKDHGDVAGVQTSSDPNACVNQPGAKVLANSCTGACASACTSNEVEIDGVCLPFARMVHDDANDVFLGEEGPGVFVKEIGGGGLWTDDGSGNISYEGGKVGVRVSDPDAILQVNPDTADTDEGNHLFAVYSRNNSSGVSPFPTIKVSNHNDTFCGFAGCLSSGRVGIGALNQDPDAVLEILNRNESIPLFHAEHFVIGEDDDGDSGTQDGFVKITTFSTSDLFPEERTLLNVIARPEDDTHPFRVEYGTDSPRFEVDKNGLTRVYGDLQVDGSCIGCGGGGGTWLTSGSDIYFDSGNVGIGTTSPNAPLDVDGSIRAGYDSGTTSYFGRAAVGFNPAYTNDWASFGHIDSNVAGGYAVLQNAAGRTLINSASGQPIEFRENNSTKMTIGANGNVSINSPDTENPTLTLGRNSGNPTLKAADAGDWIIMDGGRVGLNYWEPDDVVIANGGGNVGIGLETTPDYTLDVKGTVGIDDFIYHNDDASGFTAHFGFPSNDTIEFYAGGNSAALTVSGTAVSSPYVSADYYSGTSNTLRFVNNGITERMRIEPNGQVRINRDSAGSDGQGLLMLRQDTSTTSNNMLGGIGFDSTDGNVPSEIKEASSAIIGYSAENHGTSDKGGYLTFWTSPIDQNDDTAGLERMRIAANGFVGIGTTSPDDGGLDSTNSDTNTVLNIASTRAAGIYLQSDTDGSYTFNQNDSPFILFDHYGNNDSVKAVMGIVDVSGSSPLTYSSSQYPGTFGKSFLLGTLDDKRVQFGTDNNVRMTIHQDGRVGIGTNTPAAGLHIKASDSGGESWVNAGILIENSNSSAGEAAVVFQTADQGSSDYWFAGVNESADFRIANGDQFTNANTLLHITASGDVISSWDVEAENDLIANDDVVLKDQVRYQYDGSTTWAVEAGFASNLDRLEWYDNTGDDGDRMRLYEDGDLYIDGGYGSLSDGRHKTNVETLADALEKVIALRGVSFQWKDRDSDKDTHLGFIAQEVKEVVPELVNEGGVSDEGEQEGYSLNYDGLIPLLTEAIKEQQAMIQALTSKVEDLEAKLNN